jgi:large subunit ribosomal protein L3
MSQIFTDDGKLLPVCLVQAGPCSVVQVKDEKNDGYRAIQVAFGAKKRLNKPESGHLKNSKVKSASRLLEFRITEADKYKIGDQIDIGVFSVGDKVAVTGTTKGRGFSGGMKRWGWSGGPGTHGSMSHRRIGSASHGHSDPGRILKGKTMPGHYGNEQVTVKNLKIVKIDKEKHLLFLSGAVPGHKNSFLIIVKGA